MADGTLIYTENDVNAAESGQGSMAGGTKTYEEDDVNAAESGQGSMNAIGGEAEIIKKEDLL